MEKGIENMKKFLINFIIGIVLMAVGTTSLIFEMGKFDRVNASDIPNLQEYGYHTKSFKLKDKEELSILVANEYQSNSYIWEYDDMMKDKVKITFSNNMDYQIGEDQIIITDTNSYRHESRNNWYDYLELFVSGLKQYKLYDLSGEDIIITTSYENRDRIHIERE